MKSNVIIFACLLGVLLSNCKGNKTELEVNTLAGTAVADSVPSAISTSTFLALSDVHLRSGTGDVTFGRHNDTGDSLWARTKIKLESVIQNEQPKFMVYLGDLPHHSDRSRVTNVTLMLKHLRSLKMKIPLLYLPGNNDALGGDYNSFQDSSGHNPFSVDSIPSDPWPVLHDASGQAKLTKMDFSKEFGYYAADLNMSSNTLKVIALNSVIFTKSYYKSDDGVSQQAAAEKQLHWLERTLDSLDSKQPILMMMHIPPGIDNYGNYKQQENGCDTEPGPMWNEYLRVTNLKGDLLSLQNAFLNLVNGKKDQIKGILTSHTHFDGIRRLYSSQTAQKDSLIGISMSTPGITIGHGNNPGFKLYTYNNATYDILDFKTHFANPTVSNYGTFKFEGDSSYTFKTTYKVTDPNASIYESIAGMSDADLKTYMSKIIAVKSIKTRGIVRCYEFDTVMNVLYQK